MVTGTQLQTSWAPWSRDFAERLETHLAEAKHQGELKHQDSELARGRLLHAHRPMELLLCRPWDLQSLGLLLSPTRAAVP
jgi:hypothetical protein